MTEKKEYIEKEILKAQDFQDFSPSDVLYAIEHCPTADVVAVTRCKNCRYFYKAKSRIGDAIVTSPLCKITGAATSANDFCSYGEKSESEDEK